MNKKKIKVSIVGASTGNFKLISTRREGDSIKPERSL